MSPLAKKLQMKPRTRWLLFNAPDTYLSKLESLPDGVELSFKAEGIFDGAQLFVKDSAELTELSALKPLCRPLSTMQFYGSSILKRINRYYRSGNDEWLGCFQALWFAPCCFSFY